MRSGSNASKDVSKPRNLSRMDGSEEVGEEAVGGGFNAGIVFDDGEAENVEVEADGGAGAFEVGERIAGEKKFGADHTFDPGAAAFGAANELVAHACGADAADFFGAKVAQARALDLIKLYRNSH